MDNKDALLADQIAGRFEKDRVGFVVNGDWYGVDGDPKFDGGALDITARELSPFIGCVRNEQADMVAVSNVRRPVRRQITQWRQLYWGLRFECIAQHDAGVDAPFGKRQRPRPDPESFEPTKDTFLCFRLGC